MHDALEIEQYLQSLSGQEFEKVCGQLFSAMGFTIEYTKASGDGGIDIIAKNSTPLLKGKYIIQCKRYSGSVGQPIIRDLYGVVTSEHAAKGILITTGSFTVPAKEFAANLPIELIDGSILIQLLLNCNIETSTNELASNTDYIANILEKFFCEEEYIQHKKKCNQENYSISSVGALANFLYGKALEADYGYGLTPGIPDRIILLEEIRRILTPFRSYIPVKEKNKNNSVKLCVCMLILAQTNFLLGNYQSSKELYSHILGWKDLTDSLKSCNGLVDLLWDVLFDMCSFYSSIGEKSQASQWLEHPTVNQLRSMKRSILTANHKEQSNINLFRSEGSFNKYYQEELDDIDNIIEDPCFHPVECASDFFISELLYDPILECYSVPSSVIRTHFFNGNYKVKNTGEARPSVWFIYTDNDGKNAAELLI